MQVDYDRKQEAKRRKKAEEEARRRKEVGVWVGGVQVCAYLWGAPTGLSFVLTDVCHSGGVTDKGPARGCV